MKFRLVSGSHVEEGVTYDQGDIVESDLNLAEVFVNKFEEEVSTRKKKGEKVPEDDRGKDVTSQFPIAKDLEIDIFKTSKGYTAYDNGEALNDSPIKKAEMTALLVEFESESVEID